MKPHTTLYLLAVGVWGCPADAKAADVTIAYDGGAKQTVTLTYGKQLSGWWGPQEVPKGVIAWTGKNGRGANIGVYLIPIDLNTPGKGVRFITVKAEKPEADKPDGGSLVLLGATAGDKKAADILPAELAWGAWDGNGTEGWFPLDIKYDDGMTPAPWSAAFDFFKNPSGSLGWTVANGENFEFEKAPGKSVRFKGICTTGSGFYPSMALAKRYALLMRKYGFNQVRFHSLFDALLKAEGNWVLPELNPDRMEKFDKLFFELKQAGIYVTISGVFGARWAESTGVKNYDKIPQLSNVHYIFDEKHQELYLKSLRLFLEHVNPLTKMRYVDDPTFNMYKVVNESSIFFNGFQNLPGFYSMKLQDLYNDWLIAKYKTDPNLRKAWKIEGDGPPLNAATENLSGKTVALLAAPTMCTASQKKRVVDQTHFYYELELNWYTKVRALFRELGGKALVQGSSWGGPGHLQEIQSASNAQLDFHGKHAYWLHPHGGWSAAAALFGNMPIVDHPTDHLLQCMYQHVAGKPLAITEWNFCYPNDYTVDAAPFMAAYGALQNVGANHRFNLDSPELTASKSNFFNIFSDPGGLGAEAISYFMYVRGDVKPAPVIYQNCITEELLHNSDRKKGLKTVESTNRFYMLFDPQAVPNEVMLAGGVRISLDEKKFPAVWDEAAYKKCDDKAAKTVTSVTGELAWDYGNKNIKVLTKKTRAVMGFLKGLKYSHEGLSFSLDNGYGVAGFSSLDDKPLEESSKILITLVGRNRNSGQELERLFQGKEPYVGLESFRVGKIGGSPLILEPVGIEFSLKTAKNGDWTVTPVDAACRAIAGKETTIKAAGGKLSGKLSNKPDAAFSFVLTAK